jgi:PEP-CTERM motif
MKSRFVLGFALLIVPLTLCLRDAEAQSVLFDFDSAPLHAPLPLDLTVGGITAHFSSSSALYNYSIQRPSDVIGFTPTGFSGYAISPSTVYASDLLISFGSTLLTDVSIMYAPEEYATDSSCTMRISAYLGNSFVGTNTFSIPTPGTWPTGTLSFTSAQPFDNVVIHYDAPPVTGGDYGPIFMADNLAVTPAPIPEPGTMVMLVAGLGFLAVARRRKAARE